MNGAGLDWLNTAALKSDSDLPPPPVSFGVTPTSSSSSLNLAKDAAQSANLRLPSSSSRPTTPSPVLEETAEDLSVPLSLSGDQLTREEAKTYLRWYNDIVVRKGTSLILLHDVFNFLSNFNLPEKTQKLLEKLFKDCVSLNLGEFFALLRVISHTLLGETPRRRLIRKPAPILKPKSILSAKRQQENNDDDEINEPATTIQSTSTTATNHDSNKFDLDSFTRFILTGHTPNDQRHITKKKKHSKRVKFSDQVSVEPTSVKNVAPVKIDFSLPMDQLLNTIPHSSKSTNQPINEEEELKEMQDQFTHFQNVKNVDSALIHGVPSNIPSIFFDEVGNGISSPDPSQNSSSYPMLAPNHTGPVRLLSPSHTGPIAPRFNTLSPSYTGLQVPQIQNNGFTSPTRNSPSNISSNGFLSPNITGTTDLPTPLAPSMTGSLSSTMRQASGPPQFPMNDLRPGSVSPAHRNITPPAPPQRRARSASSPIPFDPQGEQPSLLQLQQQMQQEQQEQHHQRTVSPLLPPPPPPPARRNRGVSLPPPPPPPSRHSQGPALPPKIALEEPSVYDRVLQDYSVNGTPIIQQQQQQHQQQQPIQTYPYLYGNGQSSQIGQNDSNSSSTADILGDLKALQSEVNRLQSLQR